MHIPKRAAIGAALASAALIGLTFTGTSPATASTAPQPTHRWTATNHPKSATELPAAATAAGDWTQWSSWVTIWYGSSHWCSDDIRWLLYHYANGDRRVVQIDGPTNGQCGLNSASFSQIDVYTGSALGTGYIWGCATCPVRLGEHFMWPSATSWFTTNYQMPVLPGSQSGWDIKIHLHSGYGGDEATYYHAI